MKFLVTGGAGFIGSHLAKRCRAEGHEVSVLDDLSTGRESNVPEGCRLLKLDLAAPDLLRRLPDEDFDAVMHLAAQSSGEISSEDPLRDMKVNLEGTVALLQWAAKRAKRFLYASSMAVYGNAKSLPIREEDPAEPLSFYGLNKLASEAYLWRFQRPDFPVTALRMFSVYGPGQNMENMKQGMLSIYMAYALKGEPVTVKGSRDRFRDFVYVDDVVDAWLLALRSPKAAGRVYNVASGTRTHVWEAVEQVLRALGRDPKSYPVVYAGSTPADQFGAVADIARIKSELGWAPRVALADGLKRMAGWAAARP